MQKRKSKKFDYILMNPPYDAGLHIKFLLKIQNLCKKYISIQPISFLQKNYLYNYKNEEINNISCDNVEIITVEDSNKYFTNIENRIQLGIVLSNNTEIKNNNIKSLDIFSIDKKIIDKCIDYVKRTDNLDNNTSKEINSKLFLKLSDGAPLFGNGKITKATFRFFSLDYNIATSNKKVGHIIYLNNIPSENIRKNLFDFYGSIFMRYYIKEICLGESLYNIVPFIPFNKFNNKWIEKDYKNFFINNIGLSEDEWNFYKNESLKLPQ